MGRLNADIERLNRINLTTASTGKQAIELENASLKPIEFLVIAPGMELGDIFARHTGRVPASARTLLRGMGALNHAGQPLLSYLLFEGPFCRELVQLGYEDGLRQRDSIEQLFAP